MATARMKLIATNTVALDGRISTDASGYRRLIRFYNECNCHKACSIFIDLSSLERIDANLSALLQAILYKLNRENDLNFSFDIKLIELKFPILLRNGFLSSLSPLPDGARSTVRSEVFQQNDDEAFYTYITDDLLSHPQMANFKCDNLIGHYLELFANIQKHAETHDPIFACGQYFLSQSKLYFTIVDLG